MGGVTSGQFTTARRIRTIAQTTVNCTF